MPKVPYTPRYRTVHSGHPKLDLLRKLLILVVGRAGFEPATNGLKVIALNPWLNSRFPVDSTGLRAFNIMPVNPTVRELG